MSASKTPDSAPPALPPALRDVLARFKESLAEKAKANRYLADPVLYAWEVHGVWLWGKQASIARRLMDAPSRVLVKSANSIGKTKVAGVLAAWFFDCFDPGVCIITGPRFDQIKDTTFKEIRGLKAGHPGLYPKLPRLEAAPDHYINGTTASTGDAFQGIHCDHLMLLFEECTGVAPIFWEAARGIKAGGTSTFWLAICNPTDPTSAAYLEEQSGRWDVLSVSAFEHPNVAAELTGNPPPVPAAVRLGQLREHMDDWGDATRAWPDGDEVDPTDVDLYDPATYGVEAGQEGYEVARGVFVPVTEVIEGARDFWPSRHWRPGPVGESRILGRYPKQSAYSLFSEALFDLADRVGGDDDPTPRADDPAKLTLQIGCDVARFGDDFTSIHARLGPYSLEHVSYRGRDTAHTAGACKRLADKWGAELGRLPHRVPVMIDDTGVGGGVTDQRGKYNFVPVNAQQSARSEEKYPNARSEMLFDLAEQMAAGKVGLAGLPPDRRAALRQQAVGVTYRLDAGGRRVAEPTEMLKKRIGRSPDDLVGLALAYYTPGSVGFIAGPAAPVRVSRPNLQERLSESSAGSGSGGERDWHRRDEPRDDPEPPAEPDGPDVPAVQPVRIDWRRGRKSFYGR